jgi:hypothetical protein
MGAATTAEYGAWALSIHAGVTTEREHLFYALGARGLVRIYDNLDKASGAARMVLDIASPASAPASAFSLTHIDPYLVCSKRSRGGETVFRRGSPKRKTQTLHRVRQLGHPSMIKPQYIGLLLIGLSIAGAADVVAKPISVYNLTLFELKQVNLFCAYFAACLQEKRKTPLWRTKDGPKDGARARQAGAKRQATPRRC